MTKRFSKILIPAAFVLCASLSIIGAAMAQSTLRTVPIAYCSLSSMSAATFLSSDVCGSFTGTGSGTNLTAASVSGVIQPGLSISGTGVPAGTTIVSQSSGTPGGAGVYVTSAATTSNSATITASGIPFPTAGGPPTYAVICAYTQGVVYRDDGGTPTGTPGTGGQGIAAGQCIPYNATFSALQFIQQTSGAVLGISYYR